MEIYCLEFYQKVYQNSDFSHRNLELLNDLDVISKRVSEQMNEWMRKRERESS